MLYGEITEISFRFKNPPKSVTVRLPTDEEWIQRLAHQRTLVKDLGRRATMTELVTEPARDLAFVKAVTVDGDEVDAAEAERIVNALAGCEIQNVTEDASGYRVELAWRLPGGAGGVTVHRVRIPTMRELQDYRRKVLTVVDKPYGYQELTVHLQPALELYDKILISVDGYAKGVTPPPPHKSAVVAEVVQLARQFDDGDAMGFPQPAGGPTRRPSDS